jgi:hypothetical protein
MVMPWRPSALLRSVTDRLSLGLNQGASRRYGRQHWRFSMASHNSALGRFGQWMLREGKELLLLTAYFYVAFVVIIFYKAAVLHSYGIRYVVFGFAIAKAVLIAKFLLIGRKVRIGEVRSDRPLIKPIATKLAGFMAILLLLSAVEQVTTTLIHHRPLGSLLQGLRGAQSGEILAEVFILFLVLVPLVAFTVFGEALGGGTLQDLLFKGGRLHYHPDPASPGKNAERSRAARQ